MNDIIIIDNDQQLVSENPAVVYLFTLGKSSRRTMRGALENIAQLAGLHWHEIEWHTIRYQDTQAIRMELIELYKPNTVNRHLSALRGVLRQCWRLEYIDSDTYHRVADVKNVANDTKPKGRMLKDEELIALLQACGDDILGIRDRAMLSVLWQAGLRRAEVVNLKVKDYDSEKGRILIRRAKGNKDRVCFISGKAKEYLDEWLSIRKPTVHLFTSVNSDLSQLSPQTVYDIVKRCARRIGIEDISPHDFRRTTISRMLDEGVDIATVAAIVGHSRLDTTKDYDRRGEESLSKAAEAMKLE